MILWKRTNGKIMRQIKCVAQMRGFPNKKILGSFAEKTWDTMSKGHLTGICCCKLYQLLSSPSLELTKNITRWDWSNFCQNPGAMVEIGTFLTWLSWSLLKLSSTTQVFFLKPFLSLVCLCQGLQAISCWLKPHSAGRFSLVQLRRQWRKWWRRRNTEVIVLTRSPGRPSSISILQTSLSSPLPSSP